MSDIDFDELDKAVNSLMGKASVPKEDSFAQSTLSINSTLKEDEKPPYDVLNKVTQELGAEAATTGEGKDDKDLGPTNDTARVIKLEPKLPEGATLPAVMDTPVTPVAAVSSVPVTPVAQTPAVSAASTSPVSDATASKPPSSGRFMDVVHPSSDMRGTSAPSGSSNAPPRLVGPVPPMSSPGTSIDTPTVSSLPPAEVAVASPFLADAKVEKRPLGGEPPTGGPAVASDAETATTTVGDTMNVDFDNAVEDETLGVKTNDQQRTLNPVDFTSEVTNQEKQIQSIESAFDAGVQEQTIRSVESGDTEKMSQSAGATSAQSVIRAPKQRSGWGIVVIITVVIVLSVIAAGAAYLFVVKP